MTASTAVRGVFRFPNTVGSPIAREINRGEDCSQSSLRRVGECKVAGRRWGTFGFTCSCFMVSKMGEIVAREVFEAGTTNDERPEGGMFSFPFEEQRSEVVGPMQSRPRALTLAF